MVDDSLGILDLEQAHANNILLLEVALDFEGPEDATMTFAHGLLDYLELHLFLESFEYPLPVDMIDIRLCFMVNRGFQNELYTGIVEKPFERRLQIFLRQGLPLMSLVLCLH